MTTLILVIVLVSVAVPAALAFAHWRLQKRDRIRLRLHAGRRRLLGEEIERRAAELVQYDESLLAPARFDADRALDELHVAMMDREAHVLNCQDLAHLQRHKIAVQEQTLAQLLAREMADRPEDDDGSAAAVDADDSPGAEGEGEPLRERRDRIEEGLLDKIAESNKKQPRHRRRQ